MSADKENNAPLNAEPTPYGWDCAGTFVRTRLAMESFKKDGINPTPLYTAPVSAEPTDDEIIDMAVEPLGFDCDRMPYGVIVFARTLLSRYSAAPVAAQPDQDLTQQTLDDVIAGIPARDAEIAALRKEIETLQRAQAQPTFDDLQALAIKHGAWVPGYGPFAAELLATYGLAPEKQPHWVTGWLNAMNAVNAKAAQQPVSGADALLVEEQLCHSGHNPSKNVGARILPEATPAKPTEPHNGKQHQESQDCPSHQNIKDQLRHHASPVPAQVDAIIVQNIDGGAELSGNSGELDELEAFEIELRRQCFQQPTHAAHDLAWCMWRARAALAQQDAPDGAMERALTELVDKIVPDLDTGDLLADAATASKALDRAQPSGNPGSLPELTIQWHDTPEAVHRIFWEKTAIENGLTYEELIEGAMVGETEERQKVDLTYEQEIQAIRDQKCWGCADTDTNQINVWAAPDVDRALLIHMLAHEIGHLTGDPHPDDIQEELRAETFGKVAALAYHMLPSSQDADKVDADRYRAWRDAAVANSTQFVIAMRKALPPEAWTGTPRWPTTTEWDAAIDAARKETGNG